MATAVKLLLAKTPMDLTAINMVNDQIAQMTTTYDELYSSTVESKEFLDKQEIAPDAGHAGPGGKAEDPEDSVNNPNQQILDLDELIFNPEVDLAIIPVDGRADQTNKTTEAKLMEEPRVLGG